MDVDRIIDEIEQLQEMFEAPDGDAGNPVCRRLERGFQSTPRASLH
jgi:hypothetical protein